MIVNDLTLNGNSAVKFSAENIRVFNQRYIYCDNRYGDGVFSTAGEYPDALIPFKEAKQYKENKAVQGKNQGIWVTFHSPKGQQAGEYSGSFTLEMDGYVQNIPVNLKVWDYDFAGNYTAESCFLIDWNAFSYAELDSSQDMYDAYAEALLDYRLQPGLLMNDIANSDADDIAYYTKKAFDFAQDERCTVVFLPFDYDHTSGDTYLVKKTMKNWLRSFVDISLESYGTEVLFIYFSKNPFTKSRLFFPPFMHYRLCFLLQYVIFILLLNAKMRYLSLTKISNAFLLSIIKFV